eukprot:6481580-Amphidinium_carterae.1
MSQDDLRRLSEGTAVHDSTGQLFHCANKVFCSLAIDSGISRRVLNRNIRINPGELQPLHACAHMLSQCGLNLIPRPCLRYLN